MYAILLALAMVPTPQPAGLIVEVEARQPVALFLNGQPIKAGKLFVTQPIIGRYVTVTAKFVAGDEIVEKSFVVRLEGGSVVTLTLTITAMPAEVLVSCHPTREEV